MGGKEKRAEHRPFVRSEAHFLSEVELFEQRSMKLVELHSLTRRESDVLLHLARGRSSTYIGKELWLSPDTVRGHIRNIYSKLGVHSKQELIDMILK